MTIADDCNSTTAGTANAMERRSPDCQKARQLAINFINDFKRGVEPDFGIIAELCRQTYDNSDRRQRDNATRIIFSGIIEPLCDDFSERGVQLCNQVLVYLLNIVRKISGGEKLDDLLKQYRFHGSNEILQRYERIIRQRPLRERRLQQIKKIIILSRITAGADIAITSVMVHRLRKTFPKTRLILVGPEHLETMFPELNNIKVLPFIYKNDRGLLDKLTSWPPLHDLIQQEIKEDESNSILLFDPDTRMTQLGLLPLLPDSSTCYFPSRSFGTPDDVHSNLSVLTNNWLNTILGENVKETPYLVLHNEGHGYNAFCQKLKARGCTFIIMINFGVGNDFRKKISGSFEEELLIKLAQSPQTIIILDSGRGKDESLRVQYLLKRAGQKGIKTCTLNADEIPQADIKFNNGLITFSGSLDALGKMICAADCFIGYDSCGQHLAAATGSPAVIVFAGAPSQRFIERWSPEAENIKTITADNNQANTEAGCQELIAAVTKFIKQQKHINI